MVSIGHYNKQKPNLDLTCCGVIASVQPCPANGDNPMILLFQVLARVMASVESRSAIGDRSMTLLFLANSFAPV